MEGGSGRVARPAPTPAAFVIPPTFRLGRHLLNRLGFGAMRITGPEIWGPPGDRNEVLRTQRRLPELGFNFIDTANSYGPDVSEELIRHALYPYDRLFIATKGGLVRISAEDRWLNGRPEHLIAEAKRSCDKLGVSSLHQLQKLLIVREEPKKDQFAAIMSLLDDGSIRHAGLCE